MKECEATDVGGIILQSFVDCYRLSLLNGNFISKVKPGKNYSQNYVKQHYCILNYVFS